MSDYKLQEGLDALDRIKLLMEYDMSKTLSENETLLEQGATTTTTTFDVNQVSGYAKKWYKETEKDPEKEGADSALKDIMSLSTPTGFVTRRASNAAEEMNKDEEEMGAKRMTPEERNQLFYTVPLPPNNQNKKSLLIPKMWDDIKQTYDGAKNTYTLWGQKSISDEMKEFGMDKWKGTAWQTWIPSEKKWREMFPSGTLRNIWIGNRRFSSRISLPDNNTEKTTGEDYYFTWYIDDNNNPYVEKDFMNPEGKNPFQKKFANPWWEDSHVILELTQMALCFLPPAGPIIGGMLGLVNAGLYNEEGKTYDAGLQVVFALLPIALEIPGVKQLGSKGMAALASKFAKTIPEGTQKVTGEMLKQFTEQERNIISEVTNVIKNNPEGVAQSIDDAGIKLIETAANKETNEVAKKVAQELLKKASKSRLILRKGGQFVSGMVPYVAADVAYGQAYKTAEQNLTIKGKIEKEGLDWQKVKTQFFSSGSDEDNKLLSQAWEKGWRPGKPIPEEFKTKKFKENEEEEKKYQS